MTTAALLFARSNNRLFTSEYVEWAVSMLERGCDSRSLRVLAGLDGSSLFEAEDYFERTRRELGLAEPSVDECRLGYACELVTRILNGRLSAEDGVSELFRLCSHSQYSEPYVIWYYLEEALADINAGSAPWSYPMLTQHNVAETVRAEAERFLREFCSERISHLTRRCS